MAGGGDQQVRRGSVERDQDGSSDTSDEYSDVSSFIRTSLFCTRLKQNCAKF